MLTKVARFLRRRSRRTSLAMIVVLAGGLAACGTAQRIGDPAPPTATSAPVMQGLPAGFGAGPPGQGLARYYHQQVTWTPCGDSDKCASVWVPLDYVHPDGLAITIRAKMRPSGDPAHAFGTIFVNPGGPGRSGIAFLDRVDFAAPVTSESQVVGFDPRGVGESTPVHCLPSRELDAYVAADRSPDSPSEIATLLRMQRHFARGCVRESGPLLSHVSTIEAARDMDILRSVVLDPYLNYYGASYGTGLGATYAALFPHRVGRMVLDGGVDPDQPPHARALGQTIALQTALTAYLTDCVSGKHCPLGGNVTAAQMHLIELFRQIDADPLPTASGRDLTEGLAFSGLVQGLSSRARWSVETRALDQALAGSGDALLSLSDRYVGRDRSGSYIDNRVEAQAAVSCLDHPDRRSLADIQARSSELLEASPVFGPAATWLPAACASWPTVPTLPRLDYSAPGARPILVIGTTHDAATPYQGAVNLADEIDGGVLLTHTGEGHPAYGSGNVCIEDAVNFYLTNGRPPADGARC